MNTSDATILRLIVSQLFAVYFLLVLIPLKEPLKRNTLFIVLGALFITSFNAGLILRFGIPFYIRFYFVTLTLPYIALFSFLALYRGAKFIFALLTVQVIGNVAIINGLYASYIFYGQNTPFVDTIARVITYIIFLPLLFMFVRPIYLKMATMLNNGWWLLNASLILTYGLAYAILFIPDPIFNRPEYFMHAYLVIMLSLLIYIIIFFLFVEIRSKLTVEDDKNRLYKEVTTLTAESAVISNIAYNDSLTGVKNRYALLERMREYIKEHHNFLVVFIDLDNLKTINDTYDHSVGDSYLKQFAKALLAVVEHQGEVFRYAGDEFVCLLNIECTAFNAVHFKENVESKMIVDVPYYGISLGIACYPKEGESPDFLIRLADQAMYKEKKAKKKD